MFTSSFQTIVQRKAIMDKQNTRTRTHITALQLEFVKNSQNIPKDCGPSTGLHIVAHSIDFVVESGLHVWSQLNPYD